MQYEHEEKHLARIEELASRTPDQIAQARAQVRDGDLSPVKELLYDSALLLHDAALAAITMAHLRTEFPAKYTDSALKAVEAVRQIFITLAEHDDSNRLSSISASLFQENLEKIMRYIARKGGKVLRHDLLTSRVIQANALDYDKHLAALIDAGYLAANQTGRMKDLAYFLIVPDAPMIEVLDSAKGERFEGATPYKEA